MIIKTNTGDWALVIGKWTGLLPGVPSGKLYFIYAMKRNPLFVFVFVFILVPGKNKKGLLKYITNN